jgi:subtilisin-like proprotein convertase family protein
MNTRTLLHPLGTVFSILTLLASTTQAELRAYRAIWSGEAYMNTARAVALVVINDAGLQNPGTTTTVFAGGSPIVSMDLTVTGASSGNGTWSTAAFSSYELKISDTLNRFTEWVGQSQPSAMNAWGDLSGGHNFNFGSIASGAPVGESNYVLTTNSMAGDRMRLISFAPATAPGARVTIGEPAFIDLRLIQDEALQVASIESVKVTGLPAGLAYTPLPTPAITGTPLAPASAGGVHLQVLQGTQVLRSMPFNLAVDPYKHAGGFEVLLEEAAAAFDSAEARNEDGITINAYEAASPHPSTINMSGIVRPVNAMRVKINGFRHTWPDDVDVFLMAPNGRVAVVFSDAGGTADAVNANLVFDDSARTLLPNVNQITSGTYGPTDHEVGETLPPGSVGTVSTSLNALAAAGVNGAWKLFVSDDAQSDAGSITSWELEFGFIEPVGKLKVTIAGPTAKSPNPGYSATVERLGQPKRTARGTFTAGRSPQTVTITFPATTTLPADSYDLVLTEGSDLVTGVQTAPAPSTTAARGFRLVRPARIPGGRPALTLSLPPSIAGDRINTPGGIGHASGTVTAQALIPLKGKLGDAQPLTTSLNLSQTNQAVFWLTPYKNKASYLGGIIDIGDLAIPGRGASIQSTASGLVWERATDTTAPSYPSGFDPITLAATTSRWNPVTTAEALAQSLGIQARTIAASYLAPTADVLPSQLSLLDTFALVPIFPLFPNPSVPFTAKTIARFGTFTGTLKLPAPAAGATLSGVLLQDKSFSTLIGQGLIKIPVTAPVRGSFQTSGVTLSH